MTKPAREPTDPVDQVTPISELARRSPSGARSEGRLEDLDDGRLVVLCRGGDEQAWNTLVLRYRRLVYAVPQRMGLAPDDVDDVFLEAFARLVQGLDRLEQPHRVRSWLVTTARRLSLDAVARGKRQLRVVQAEAVVEEATALEELQIAEERDLVQRALKRLGKQCRELLRLLYAPGAARSSYRTIAGRLSMAVGSIGPTRARCLDALLKEYRRLERMECIPNRRS